ncbi:hypothetical protein HYU07_00230 [Candidatus Woesearchaeota archaeon]|nr:hypothetical protein [Candidatus Woesearchaeota archaeon]
MEIKLNIAKKHLYILMAFVLAVVGLGLVIAFNTESPETFGHSSGEVMVNISGMQKTLQKAIDAKELGGGRIPLFFSGTLPTSVEWEADVIINGNYARLCDVVGRTYDGAVDAVAHYTHLGGGRGGYFYKDWYYVGPRFCDDDTWYYGSPSPDGLAKDDPANLYTVWRYSGNCGCCPDINGWTFERRAIVYCK